MIDTQNPLVFVSYSHGDYKWRDALKLHLDSLFWTKSHMRLFVDSGMVSGAEYERDITAALAHTTVGVLIVSPSFLRSPFIQRKELPLMLKRQRDNLMDIVPIIVEPCVWDEREDLRQFLAPLDGTPLSTLPQREQKKMLLEIARQINQRYRERLDVSQKITVVIGVWVTTVQRTPT